MSFKIKLIVGLGNPGDKYSGTRHNVGFEVIDELKNKYNFPEMRSKFDAHISSFIYNQRTVFVAKPQTYMNNSGISVRKIIDYYKINTEELIVIHDDIDLEVARVKFKIGGGHAGHNGLKSIDQHLGNNYARVRIGVGHPEHRSEVSNFVLGNFSKLERTLIDDKIKKIVANFDLAINSDYNNFIANINN